MLVGREAERRPSQAERPCAALHRLLRPVLPALSTLAVPHARAVHRALGMEPDEGPDRFLVSRCHLQQTPARGR